MTQKFSFSFTINGEVTAPTLEAARQTLDNAIDFSELRKRGIEVEGTHENFYMDVVGETSVKF